MGRVVTFTQAPTGRVADGVETAPITAGDTREMAADFIRIAPGKRWGAAVPSGSDCYLFMLSGTGVIAAGARHRFPAQAFATVEEGVEFSIANDGRADAEIVKVLAPPAPKPPAVPAAPAASNAARAGFRGTIAVAQRTDLPVVHIPEQKKKRIYFVGDHAAQSARGHAMIVVYDKDTVTGLHHHPDAESLFVVLDGALAFTVNGAPVVVAPGQAAYFGIDDRHGLTTAEGCPGASFLEFHIPAAFTTVKG
jgi:mannose-6-phosphate isomerase-like protein (cupin superfamily)